MTVTVRSLQASDRAQWEPLWDGYLAFYEQDISGDVTDATWQRLLDPEFDMHGLCATDGDGALVGIVHYLFHPVTWSTGPRCYLEDLFVTESARGAGAGRALIEAVYKAGDERGADQVYWLTADDNATARKLYDRVANLTPFIKYMR